jgi:hypothetical protein
MDCLRVFKDQHTVRTSRAEYHRETTRWWTNRPPPWANWALPAASHRQLSPTLSLRCLGLEKNFRGSFTRYFAAFPS